MMAEFKPQKNIYTHMCTMQSRGGVRANECFMYECKIHHSPTIVFRGGG
jgi:hypothetical protein